MKRLIALTASAILVWVPMQGTALASPGEMWYLDMVAHWAHDHVRLLWEEQVSDGVQGSWGGCSSSVFMPQAACTRAQFAVLLAKSFRLAPKASGQTFCDVPPGYCICYNKPAHPYIEAAAARSLIRGAAYGVFAPERAVRREEAVSMIIRGLDISHFLDTLDSDRIASLLGRFFDGSSVSQSLRKEMAAAIFLKVVHGYPDRTLRPSQDLLRAEAAALIARSCMIKARSSLPCFSPDGDGVEDTVVISLETLKNRAVLDYGIVIDDLAGQPVRRWYGWTGSFSHLAPCPETWDGRDAGGRLCGDGLYLYAAWVRDRQGQVHWSASKPLVLERPAVWAFVNPAVVKPGDHTELSAYATGQPDTVVWKDTGSQMTRVGTRWIAGVQVSPVSAEGEHRLTVQATYPSSAVRQAVALYTVVDPFPLAARVVPSPASPGQLVTVLADTSGGVTGVDAALPWEDSPLPLTRISPVSWRLEDRVPPDTRAGRYSIRVTARTPSKIKTVTVWLDIEAGPLRDLVFSLVS
jgi:hypothetical protein